MLVIRFIRIGKKNQPFFRIVVTDKRNPARAGRFLEVLGFYNPLTKEKKTNKERINYWISKGAQPSDTVYNLLVKEGIVKGKKIDVHKKSKKEPAAVKAEVKQIQEPEVKEEIKEAETPKPAEAEETK